MPDCLPPCAADVTPCMEIVAANPAGGAGGPCTLDRSGVWCAAVSPCESRCAVRWENQILPPLLAAGHRWLVFLGDSDTRGLALGVIQMLVRSAAVARGDDYLTPNRSLWLPDVATGGEPSRVCHLDWSFDAVGAVLATRSLLCRKHSKSPYIELDREYSLAAPTAGAALRLTYIAATRPKAFVNALGRLGGISSAPTLFVANTGAWHPVDDGLKKRVSAAEWAKGAAATREELERRPRAEWMDADAATIAVALEAFADRFAAARLVWGTAVSHRTWAGVDKHLVGRLSSRWTVLRRNASALLHGERHASVKLSSGHMPHLVNIVDFHRLLTALSGGGCVSPKAIGFDPACAGHGPAEKERTYIEAYRHFCRVWPV